MTADERLIGLFGRMLEQAAAQAETDPFLPAFLDESPHWTVDSMAEIVGVKAMTLRSLCSRNQLPTPGRWRTFCRLMVHALVLQRHPERTLTRHAIVLGYSASQDLSHAFQAGFGVTPSHVQERLGWQWLGWKWVTTRKRL